ncbi:MAG TPA: RNase H family protein [Pyrinomonadaceae bacterium]|jgi:ribonuclease HI
MKKESDEKEVEGSAVVSHPSSLIPARLKSVTIYCDGSSLGNGQTETRAAAVALLGYRGIWRAVGAYLGVATNQQAEIVAAALGLEALREPCRVRVVTDSRYVVETMSGRFRRKSNQAWWARLDEAARLHKIEWEWAKGHAGHIIQEAADRAARRIAALGRADESVLRDAVDRIGITEATSEASS